MTEMETMVERLLSHASELDQEEEQSAALELSPEELALERLEDEGGALSRP